MESLFSTLTPSFSETPSRIQSADQNKLTEIACEIINVMEHFATDLQEFKANTAGRVDKIERQIMGNATEHDSKNRRY